MEITKKFADGEEMTLALMEAGDFFGEMALLDQGPRSASVRALTETTTLELSRESFEQLLLEEPTIAYGIMRELGKRLRETGSLLVAHLERINGKGYPGGLSGQSIPLFGRIIAVADSFDAMMSDRPLPPSDAPDASGGATSKGNRTAVRPPGSGGFSPGPGGRRVR